MDNIQWKIHLRYKCQKVYEYLSTNEGREKFWAESAIEEDGNIHFIFINGWEYKSRIICQEPFSRFEIEYFNAMVRLRAG